MAKEQFNAFISYSHVSDEFRAEGLQAALQLLAKPWYRKQALTIFRDQTDLSVSPHLWDTIEDALSRSEYFILLASPSSATSKWIAREVGFWLTHKPIETMILVLTDGELYWDDARGIFDPERSTALPAALADKYQGEPHYVDLRSFERPAEVSVENQAFSEAIFPLAAELHHKPVKVLFGEIERNHRKAVRVRNVVIVGLVSLLLLAVVMGMNFLKQRDVAIQETKAKEQRLSELYWSYARDSHDNEDYLLAWHYASHAATLLPERGYAASFLTLQQPIERYALQHVASEETGNRPAIEFVPDLQTVGAAEDRWNRVSDFSEWPDVHSEVEGALISAEDNLIVAWHRDQSVSIRDAQTLHEVVEPFDHCLDIRRAWYWKAASVLFVTVRIDDDDDDDSENGRDDDCLDDFIYDDERRRGYLAWDVEKHALIADFQQPFGLLTEPERFLYVFEREGRDRGDPDTYHLRLGAATPSNKGIRFNSRPRAIAVVGNTVAVALSRSPSIVEFRNAKSGKRLRQRIHHPEAVTGIRLSGDGRQVEVSGAQGTRYLWTLVADERPQVNFDNPAYYYGIISPTGKELLLWSHSRVTLVRLNEMNHSTHSLPTQSHVRNGLFAPESGSIALWSQDGLEVWDTETKTLRFHDPSVVEESIVRFTPDESYVFVATGEKVKALQAADGADASFDLSFGEPITAMDISSDGRLVAIAGEQLTKLWFAGSDRNDTVDLVHEEPVARCLFVNRDCYLLCVGEDSRYWNVTNPRRPSSRAELGAWDGASVAADGNRALLWRGNTAQLVELPTGRVMADGLSHKDTIIGASAVPNGSLFRSWDRSGMVRTWWAFTGSPLGKLEPRGIVEPRSVSGSTHGDALLFFDYDEGPRTTYLPLANGDEDFPEELALLQAHALTGATIDFDKGRLVALPAATTIELREEYLRKLHEHSQYCTMPDRNPYRYLADGWENKRIRDEPYRSLTPED